jgi:glycerol kinase
VAEQALKEAKRSWKDVESIGITNQRETTILWDPETGQPIYPAIVWQDRRTALFCKELKAAGLEELFHERTGLLLDPYFSGTKIHWITEHTKIPKKVLFGTVDTWALWHLTKGLSHATDSTNASRTLLYDIVAHSWSEKLRESLQIPQAVILPEVYSSSSFFGETDPSLTGGVAIPTRGIAGDQQAALYGQGCREKGNTKSTYGTGTFLMMHTGSEPIFSESGLLTTVSCEVGNTYRYALEGSVFYSGALLDWAVDKLGLASTVAELDKLAATAKEGHGVHVVPAFVGLGAPHWRSDVRAAIMDMEASTTKAEIAHACFEAIAFQTKEVLDVMQKESGCSVDALQIDGGVTKSALLCQLLADVLQVPIQVSSDSNLTARGAAYLAGLQPRAGEYHAYEPKEKISTTPWQEAQSRLIP